MGKSADETAKTWRDAIGLAQPFIEKWEKFVPSVYYDKVGKKYTIGHGHTYVRDAATNKMRPVRKNESPMSLEKSRNAVGSRLRSMASALYRDLPWMRRLNSHQIAALLDIAYNSGEGTLYPSKSPGLNKRMSVANADFDAILREEIPTYRKASGKISKGLSNRRSDAVKTFLPMPVNSSKAKALQPRL